MNTFYVCEKCNANIVGETCPICRKPGIQSVPARRKLSSKVNTPLGGPGTELEQIIPSIFKSKTCSCRNYARRMDRWGVEGCEQRFDEIVSHLCSQAKSRSIFAVLGKINRMVAVGWTRQAIDRARSKSAFHWAALVTTAPRKEATLYECIESLRNTGWEPTVFAEPGSLETDCETVWNPQKLGVWHNWLSACKHTLRTTKATHILTAQDDIVMHSDSKQFVETLVIDKPDYLANGFISLYTPKHYSIIKKQVQPVGVRRVRTKSLWGACAIVWSRQLLSDVVNQHIAKAWIGAPTRSKGTTRRAVYEKRRKTPSMIANSDTAIGKIMNNLNKHMYFVDPSPAEHIATSSTINHGDNKGQRNCWRCAETEKPLYSQVFPPAVE